MPLSESHSRPTSIPPTESGAHTAADSASMVVRFSTTTGMRSMSRDTSANTSGTRERSSSTARALSGATSSGIAGGPWTLRNGPPPSSRR